MRLSSIVSKSIKEQLRNYWILLLTVLMAPFFVFIYYLIVESSEIQYDITILNNDKSVEYENKQINFGNNLIDHFTKQNLNGLELPFRIKIATDNDSAIKRIKTQKSDVMIVIPSYFSDSILNNSNNIQIEFIGDLTNQNYLIGAVWSYELISSFITKNTDIPKQFTMVEKGIGSSGNIDDFQYSVPGLLILSIIMLMFSASIAIISEVENKTMIRLKLSKLKAWEFLSGVGIVQVIIGIIAIYLTLIVAVLLGFDLKGSLFALSFIALLTSISIVGFSLIITALTKSANEILIVGNFPLFLFMFFTGAAFPIEAKPLCYFLNYPVSLQGLMSPTHSIEALKKVMIMNMEFPEIIPELLALSVITFVYYLLGIWLFNKRHMKLA